ncbi:hypothetical protein NtRootA4_27950 [Arthrobacter sp. NtRootA4]|nr:hypothetical protein NtRootA2_30140 [Arthrobacter sp. NtRootA2]BCW15816.1 hypothetical protein NtRootA4_27950 [Arthrobacter sp. NtRootA4]BCW24149.1 hypothetical protein NtRootC7_30160 [Arthrobacter sp. NtRootC7]BCW28417.1 hypothetical protein NtRootC45_30170 [Arthrobacter sp. NtRootC45]BCW32688.1 hypothetical protein NtRootD5_30190 [Arthrobacter sp. NtRootD5]
MSVQVPSPEHMPVSTSNNDPAKTVKARTSVGVGLMVFTVLTAAGSFLLYLPYISVLESLTDADRSEQVGFIALNACYLLALLGTGIWNVAARRSSSKVPLLAALVMTLLALTLSVVNTVDAVVTTGRLPGVFITLLLVALIIQTIKLLRAKRL